ncbi:MAG: ribonuclease D [Alphaproteobacteria bacterium]|nr:ribonuclease D [Alphaproteobacteria bacterium]
MTVTLYKGDIPSSIDFGSCVAIDTETMGLKPVRDRLCLVQLSSGDGNAHLVQFVANEYSAPNLKKMLADQNVVKLFHFARFDVAALWMYLNVLTTPVYCTKIASRLARTFTQHHSLKTLCNEMLNIEISKQQQTSDWGASTLTEKQIKYAASDVLYLHQLKDALDSALIREGRMELAQSCFNFLPSRSLLDVAGWSDEDIFAH